MEASGLVPVMTFCGNCNCGCPELSIDNGAPPERRMVLTDDFGQRVHMSAEQLRDLMAAVTSGALDQALSAAGI